MPKSKRTSERGVALLELALVFPFIMLVVLAAVEIKRFIAVVQQTQVLAREAASISFRDCADFKEPEGETSTVNLDRTRRCVVELLGTPVQTAGTVSNAAIAATKPGIQTFANSYGDSEATTVVVSVFRYNDAGDSNPATGTLTQIARINEQPESQFGPRNSGFSVAGQRITGQVELNEDFVRAHERIVIVEVYSHYEPILNFIPLLGKVLEREVYEVAIL